MQQILWAARDFQTDFVEELRRKSVPILARQENIFLVETDATDFVWLEARGPDAEVLRFDSVSQGAKLLRERGRLWCASPASHFRRSELLGQGLLQPKTRLRRFREKIPAGPLGCYCLVDEKTLWVTPALDPALPPGAWDFEESAEAPSRAYLKLWELFTREGFAPKAGDSCVELGSAPGGWTWVLTGLGAKVLAVDKGEMDPRLLKSPRVDWRRQDAFIFADQWTEPADWLFSDLICYPARLLQLVQNWIKTDRARNFVCTIKFQGSTDFDVLDEFLKIPGSRAIHLHHNKHEVTWFKLAAQTASMSYSETR